MRRLGHDLQIKKKMYSQICRNDFLEIMVFTKIGKPRDAFQVSKIKIFSQPCVQNSGTKLNLNSLRGFEDETRG